MAENRVSTLNGLFKEVYAPTLEYLMPKNLRLQNDIAFVPADQMPGNNFNQPVVLKHEHGFTYAAASAGAFSVDPAIAGQIENAQIVGNQMLLESILDYESAHRASSGGKRAYVQATQYLVENMWQSSRKRLEIDLFYGQDELGTIASTAGGGANDIDVVITTAEWAPGIWAGMEGAPVEVFDTTGDTERDAAVDLRIDTIDLDTRTVTIKDQAAAVDPGTGWVAGDRIFFKGQRVSGSPGSDNTMAGLHKILTNTGTLFNISATTYSLWKANTQSAGSVQLSFETIQKAVALAVGKGLDENLCLYVNPKTWSSLMTDQAALRRHGDPNKSSMYEMGSEAIEFYSMIGMIQIKSSIYVKEGYAYLISPDLFHRVGATDITFRLQDRGDEFFRHHESKAGYALRTYSNQALFSEAPGKAVLINNIVN